MHSHKTVDTKDIIAPDPAYSIKQELHPFLNRLFSQEKKRGPIALLLAIAKEGRFAHPIYESLKPSSFFAQNLTVLQKTKLMGDKLRKQIDVEKKDDFDFQCDVRNLFFNAFFDEDWNFKGSQAYIDMRISHVLHAVLPEVALYCDVPEIHEWTLNKLNEINTSKNQDIVETLSQFCHIFAAIAACRLHKEYLLNFDRAVTEVTNEKSTFSKVKAFFSYDLDYTLVMINLRELNKLVKPKSLTKQLPINPIHPHAQRGLISLDSETETKASFRLL